MAKKKGEDDIDDLDLDMEEFDLGDLDDFEDMDGDRKPSNAEIAKDLSKDASKGLFSGLASKTAKKVLPESYEYGVPEAMEYVDFSKELVGKNKTKIEKSLYGLGKEVKKILPFQSKMLDGFLEKYSSDFEKHKQESEESIREASIGGSLNSIFDKQLEVQKAIESKREATDAVESKQRMVSNKMQIDLLRSIAEQTGQQAAFTTQIGKEYYRKSLELQYKTFYIQADMLKMQREYFHGFTAQFDQVVKNTGLPDFVKLHNTELIAETMKRRTIESATKRIFDNSKFITGAKDRLSKFVDQKIATVTESIDQATGGLEMMGGSGGNPLMMVASVLSSIGGSAVGGKLADKISPKLKEKLKDNKTINTVGNNLKSMSTDMRGFLKSSSEKIDKRKEAYEGENSPMEMLLGKLLGGGSGILKTLIGGQEKNIVKNTSNILENKQPAIFDQRVHRSITEVIPMYLMRILQTNTNLAGMYQTVNGDKVSGYKSTGELMYDYNKRKLSSKSEIREGLEKDLFKDRADKVSRAGGQLVKSTLSSLKKDPKGNDKAIKALSAKGAASGMAKYTHLMSKDENFEMSRENLIDYALDETREKSDTVKAFFEENPQVLETLAVLKASNVSETSKANIDATLKDSTRNYPIVDLIKLFNGISSISGSKTKNVLSNKQAEILSRTIITFIIKYGSDFTVFEYLRGGIFKNTISKTDYEIIKNPVIISISEITKVINTDDRELISRIEVLFNAVNRAMKDGTDLNPEIWKVLNEFSPDLVGEGELTASNLVEGSLSVFKDSNENVDYATPDDIKSMIRASGETVKAAKKFTITNNLDTMLSKTTGYTKNTVKDLKTAIASGNRGEITAVFKKAGKDISGAATSAFNKSTKYIKDNSAVVFDGVNDYVTKGATFVLSKQITGITETIKGIDGHILTSKTTKEEIISKMRELQRTIEETTTSESAVTDTEKEIANATKRYDAEIKQLEDAKVILEKLKVKFEALLIESKQEGFKVENMASKVKEHLLQVKAQLGNIVDKNRATAA